MGIGNHRYRSSPCRKNDIAVSWFPFNPCGRPPRHSKPGFITMNVHLSFPTIVLQASDETVDFWLTGYSHNVNRS
jgi:hypothetical protein